jgi:hypothetical protein
VAGPVGPEAFHRADRSAAVATKERGLQLLTALMTVRVFQRHEGEAQESQASRHSFRAAKAFVCKPSAAAKTEAESFSVRRTETIKDGLA